MSEIKIAISEGRLAVNKEFEIELNQVLKDINEFTLYEESDYIIVSACEKDLYKIIYGFTIRFQYVILI